MKTYMTRTCAPDMKSFNDFTWPETGDVTCPDWDPMPYCGNGLQGLLLGCGRGGLLDWSSKAKWLLVEIEKEDIVDLGGTVKVPKGTVTFCGSRLEAIAKLEALAPECLLMPVIGAVRTAGDGGHAMVGDNGTAIAGEDGIATAGDGGKAEVGSWGTAIAGIKGKATAGNFGRATAGKYGTAKVGNLGTAIAGYYGHAKAGDKGTAQAGIRGKISLRWYDQKTLKWKTVIGYVGKRGIEPNKSYRVDPVTGTLVLAE